MPARLKFANTIATTLEWNGPAIKNLALNIRYILYKRKKKKARRQLSIITRRNSDFSLLTQRHFADDTRHDLPLCVFRSVSFALPSPSLIHPPSPIARLSPFVNCFRLTDWWMNRSIGLMHMYRYYMSTFY